MTSLAAPAPQPEPPAYPGGTVTFLFTDIQGSTRLLEQLREQYGVVLADQRDLLRAAFAAHSGREIDTQGDAFFVAFARATDAVACVVAAQRDLAAHRWPQDVTVRVRMGLHTGEPLVASTGYIGLDVHRAARIAAAGHGGQVLLSQATRELIYQDLPPGAALRLLGEYQLKDLRHPQPVYQLDIEGLPTEFPPLKTRGREEGPPAPGEPPYMGLHYFGEADAPHFFGREAVVARLVAAVTAQRFLAVVGASGSGKSSVVRAGLLPALRRGGQPGAATRWQPVVLTPTAHPLEALVTSLTRGERSLAAAADLLDDLQREPRSLRLWARQHWAAAEHAAPTRWLLVVDQFEELFTLCDSERERQAFVDNLLAAVADEGGPVSVLLTLRADFYGQLAAYPALSTLVAGHQEYLSAMSAAELRQAIEAPAAQGRWEFSPGLVDLLLHDIGVGEGSQPEPGALPLLSHALLETWKRRRGNLLSLKAYAESGGVRGAIARTAESVLTQGLTPPQRVIARAVFLRLTQPGEDTQDTRRVVSYSELLPSAAAYDGREMEEVLARLADARLIITNENSVEVAHEALIREWPTLRQWLNEDREGLRLHRHLTGAAQAWDRLGRDPGELYRGARLAQAAEWAQAHPGDPNALEQDFLSASQALATQEQAERESARQRELAAAQALAAAERQRAEDQAGAARRLRQRALLLAAALVLVVLAAGAAVLFAQQSGRNLALANQSLGAAQSANTQAAAQRATAQSAGALAQANAATAQADRNAAEQSRQLAVARELSLASITNLGVDPERSLLLALQAISATAALSQAQPEAIDALHRALAADRLEWTARGHTGALEGLALSADGTRLASLADDGTLRLWEAASGQPLRAIPAEFGAPNVKRVPAFSPDGRRVAAGARDSLVKVWDTTTGQPLLTLSGHTQDVVAVAFSPDGLRLASASADGTARLWDAATGAPGLVLTGPTAALTALAFSPDGLRLAAASQDRQVVIWDLGSGGAVLTLTQPAAVLSLAFSPDGARLATGAADTAWRLWDAASGAQLFTGLGHTTLVESVAFDRDGTRLVTASEDGTARVWDVATGQPLLTLAGHAGGVLGAVFSADGTRVVTASRDTTLKSWDVSPAGGREWFNLVGHTGRIWDLAYSPDGTLLGTVSEDGTARLWDAATGRVRWTLAGPPDGVWGLSFSPDSRWLATNAAGGAGSQIDIWSTATGQRRLEIMDSVGGNALAFSRDGRALYTSHEDGSVRQWDAQTGQLLASWTAHASSISYLAFSQDGTRLATISEDCTAKIWSADSHQLLLTVASACGNGRLAWSPDGKLLVTLGHDATVWDAATGQQRWVLTGHTGPVIGAAFSPDGRLLATTSVDRTIKLWDLSAGPGAEPLTLQGHSAAVYQAVFSPDGTRLATASRDGTARVYAIRLSDLVALAQARLTRGLTTDECQKYLHVAACP